jgi:RNA-directed DNA polymerase
MRKKQIPKKSGGFRTIFIPDEDEKKALREKLPFLHEIQEQCCNMKVVHGFSKGNNIVTNAMQHIGKKYTTCFDIKDFFDSVTEEKLISIHSGVIWHTDDLKIMFVNGAARQGLPTSPLISNIAASFFDSKILNLLNGTDIVYTRYADDLAFSYNELSIRDILHEKIPAIIKECGFEINEKKTRTMSAKRGRRIITGIAVGETEVYVPRKIKRKLRAAIHLGNRKTAIGLQEYSKLKLPRELSFEAFEKWKAVLLDNIRRRSSARDFKISDLSLGVVHKEGN